MDMSIASMVVEIIFIVVVVGGTIIFKKMSPKDAELVQTSVSQLELILKYAESFCAYARQFLSCEGSEKMNIVIEKLKEVCAKQGIEIDETTLRAIAQKAYDSMQNETKRADATINVVTPTMEATPVVAVPEQQPETETEAK